MKDTPKYDAPASETEYQPKSGNAVLRNTLGITEPTEMNDVESELLLKLYEKIFIQGADIEQLQVDTILSWHNQWLANIYPAWAGKLRSTNISKDGYGVLDYKLWDEHKEFYIRSIQAGVSGDYQYMTRLIDDILPVD